MIYPDLWPTIQQDIVGVILASRRLGGRVAVPIESGDVPSNLDAKVQTALGVGKDGKVGVGFLVLPIEEANDDHGANPGGPLKLTLTVQVVENVTLNRGPRGTKLPCRVWAAILEKELKLYTPVGLGSNLVPKSPVISQFTPDKDANMRIGQVEFTTNECDDMPMFRLSRPQIVVAGDGTQRSQIRYEIGAGNPVATLTQAAASSIYYTTDGSHPYAGNAQAKQYTAPVEITEACLLRVRAFGPEDDDNYMGSDTAAMNFV